MEVMSGEDPARVVEGSARKRKRNSREDDPTASHSQPARMESIIATGSKAACVESTPCQHENRLNVFNSEFDTLRQLVTCKICQRFLYEPYGLACGHTFCYSCLNQWIGPTKKKTCPDCRSVIKQQPTPSYLIREMVLVFINRRELLPEGETVEEHQQFAKEEAEIVNKDRASSNEENGGLFHGCFGKHGRLANYAVHDASDNVDRCPFCFTEVEDGYCEGCGLRIRNENDSFDSDSEFSEELDQELVEDLDADLRFGLDGHSDFDESEDDDEDERQSPVFSMFGPRGFPIATRARRRHRHLTDESEEESDEEDPTMDGFVVDDNAAVDVDSDSASDATQIDHNASQRQQQRRRIPVLSDDEDEEEDEQTVDHEQETSVNDSSSEGDDGDALDSSEDSEDEAPVSASSQRDKSSRRGRAHRPVAVVSDDDEDTGDDDSQTSDTASPIAPMAAFSPLSGDRSTNSGPSEDESGDNDEDDEEDDEEDDDEEEHDYGHNAMLNGHYEDDDNHNDDDGAEGYDESSDGYFWWEAFQPSPAVFPQSARHRLAILQQRRNRYADAFADIMRSRSPTSPTLPRHRSRPQPFTVTNSPHPFQLGNTLHRIANVQRRTQQPTRTSRHHHRGISTSSQGSVTGGVAVRPQPVLGRQ